MMSTSKQGEYDDDPLFKDNLSKAIYGMEEKVKDEIKILRELRDAQDAELEEWRKSVLRVERTLSGG